MKIFERFLAQTKKGSGFTRVEPKGSYGHGSVDGNIKKGNAIIFMVAYVDDKPEERLNRDIMTTLDELTHLSGEKKTIDDRAYAEVVHANSDLSKFVNFITPESSVFHPNYKFKKEAEKSRNFIGWSSYFHTALRNACLPKGEIPK